MRLKSFQARSMPEAMRLVKAALGEEAIIVSSKQTPGGLVRITAAVEQADMPAPAAAGWSDDDILETVTDAVLRHRVPASVADRIIAATGISAGSTPQETFAAALGKIFEFKPLHGKKPRPLVLVGPPGAGKTLMTAKLAAEAVLSGTRPAVITTDIARAGGVEQLQAFLDILALPLGQAEDARTLKSVLEKTGRGQQVIIDTGGLNPFDPKEMKELARLLAAAEGEAALVLPAGIDAEESAEMAMTFAVLGVKKLVPTRLDFARRLGGLLCAAEKAGLSFTSASHTPQVANGILSLEPGTLARLLMPAPEKKRGKP